MNAGSYGSFVNPTENYERNSSAVLIYLAAFLGMGYAVLSDNLVMAALVLVLAILLTTSEEPDISGA